MAEATARRRVGREGSRWFNQRPTPEEFGNWFKTVPIHDGLDHDDFLSGITLIQAKEKLDEVIGFDDDERPMIREVQHLVYVPYAKVDTRVAYFWALMREHTEWLGVIEPFVGPNHLTKGMPPGFFSFKASHGEREVNFVGNAQRVRILERDSVEYRDVTETGLDGKPFRRRVAEGKPVFEPTTGTKITAMTTKYDIDLSSVMKAETGAVGRALGMAGMLIIPGSGVATAEDMQEAAAGGGAPAASPSEPKLPTGVAGPDDGDLDLRPRIAALLATLQAEFPEALKSFQEWARERGFSALDDLSEPQQKGVVRRLEKVLDDAQKKAAEPKPEPATS